MIASFRLVLLNVITLFLFIYICCIGIKNVFRYNVLSREYKVMSNKLIKQQKIYQLLSREVSLSKVSSHWHFLAKKELGYIHPNESVYFVLIP